MPPIQICFHNYNVITLIDAPWVQASNTTHICILRSGIPLTHTCTCTCTCWWRCSSDAWVQVHTWRWDNQTELLHCTAALASYPIGCNQAKQLGLLGCACNKQSAGHGFDRFDVLKCVALRWLYKKPRVLIENVITSRWVTLANTIIQFMQQPSTKRQLMICTE